MLKKINCAVKQQYSRNIFFSFSGNPVIYFHIILIIIVQQKYLNVDLFLFAAIYESYVEETELVFNYYVFLMRKKFTSCINLLKSLQMF